MGVDLSKIKAKRTMSQDKDHNPEGVVLDSIALRKSWAKKPSYWIEIIYIYDLDLYALKKSWSYWNKAEEKQIKGHSTGGKTSSPGSIHERFVDAVNGKLTQDYEIVVRNAQDESPARGHDFGAKAEGLAEAASTVATPALGRKPSYDVW